MLRPATWELLVEAVAPLTHRSLASAVTEESLMPPNRPANKGATTPDRAPTRPEAAVVSAFATLTLRIELSEAGSVRIELLCVTHGVAGPFATEGSRASTPSPVVRSALARHPGGFAAWADIPLMADTRIATATETLKRQTRCPRKQHLRAHGTLDRSEPGTISLLPRPGHPTAQVNACRRRNSVSRGCWTER
jgi:hypothetical protein